MTVPPLKQLRKMAAKDTRHSGRIKKADPIFHSFSIIFSYNKEHIIITYYNQGEETYEKRKS